MDWLRWAVATPAYIVFAVWEWLTHDEFEDFIAEQTAMFRRLADRRQSSDAEEPTSTN